MAAAINRIKSSIVKSATLICLTQHVYCDNLNMYLDTNMMSGEAMNKIIGVTDLQRKFRKIFDEVAEDHVPYILTRGSRPEAVLIPYEQYMKYIQIDESGVLRRFNELLTKMAEVNAEYSTEEVEKDIRSARKTVRSRRHR